MPIHRDSRFVIYFGDARDRMYPLQYQKWQSTDLMSHPPIKELTNALSIDRLVFLKQVHTACGVFVTQMKAARIGPFSREGDFLITQEPYIGIGVMTADCLPVICYDQRHHLIGIAHAGWRGAVAGVVAAMLAKMQDQCATQITDILFFLGPSAKVCCYQVDDAFGQYISSYPFADTALERRDGNLYFDLPGLVIRQLFKQGVLEKQISIEYNSCTIGDPHFCSHRRATQAGTASAEGRQMTVVTLT
jgi:hypothetical protein